MNKSQLVAKVAEEQNITKKRSEELLNLILDTMQETLLDGEKIQISGFGNFEIKERAPRKGRNPRTNEEVAIGAYRKLTFKPSEILKDLVNGRK